jgi:hypothetical protein
MQIARHATSPTNTVISVRGQAFAKLAQCVGSTIFATGMESASVARDFI